MADAFPSKPEHDRLLPTPEEELRIDAELAARLADPTGAEPDVQWRDPGPDPYGLGWDWMHGPGQSEEDAEADPVDQPGPTD